MPPAPRGATRKRTAAANQSSHTEAITTARFAPGCANVTVTEANRSETAGPPAPSSVVPEDDYALKRQRNNAAVNKTRQKKKQEEMNTQTRVQQLRDENEKLERRLESMRRELELLKEMVVACASGRRNCAPAAVGTENGSPAS